jgi:hypothetical protein
MRGRHISPAVIDWVLSFLVLEFGVYLVVAIGSCQFDGDGGGELIAGVFLVGGGGLVLCARGIGRVWCGWDLGVIGLGVGSWWWLGEVLSSVATDETASYYKESEKDDGPANSDSDYRAGREWFRRT